MVDEARNACHTQENVTTDPIVKQSAKQPCRRTSFETRVDDFLLKDQASHKLPAAVIFLRIFGLRFHRA